MLKLYKITNSAPCLRQGAAKKEGGSCPLSLVYDIFSWHEIEFIAQGELADYGFENIHSPQIPSPIVPVLIIDHSFTPLLQ